MDRGPPPRQPLDSRSGNVVGGKGKQDYKQAPDTRMGDGIEDEDSDAEMQRVMGFKKFRTTKETKVPGNDKNWGVHKDKKTEYRQYMNRTGGFNRPLSPSRQ
jgi:U4/U6.U5 tri-snRNP-associated protein 3